MLANANHNVNEFPADHTFCRLMQALVDLGDMLGIVAGFKDRVKQGASRDRNELKASGIFNEPGVLALLTFSLHADLQSAFSCEQRQSLGGTAHTQLLQTLQEMFDRVSPVPNRFLELHRGSMQHSTLCGHMRHLTGVAFVYRFCLCATPFSCWAVECTVPAGDAACRKCLRPRCGADYHRP